MSYEELRGKVKVGDTVRAIPGLKNLCGELRDSGSNSATISKVDDEGFWINGCFHEYEEIGFLDWTPQPKTFDTLEVGDFVYYPNGVEKKVLKIERVFLLSTNDDHSDIRTTLSEEEMIRINISFNPPEEQVVDMTLEEVSAFVGKTVRIVDKKGE